MLHFFYKTFCFLQFLNIFTYLCKVQYKPDDIGLIPVCLESDFCFACHDTTFWQMIYEQLNVLAIIFLTN